MSRPAEDPAPTLEIGQRLRKERERKGWTLQQVADRTRIPLRYLESMEGGDFTGMPATVYVRGFLRSYCKILDLDEDAELQLLDRAGIVGSTAPRSDRLTAAGEPIARGGGPLQAATGIASRYWLAMVAVAVVGAAVGFGVKGVVGLLARGSDQAIPPSPFMTSPPSEGQGGSGTRQAATADPRVVVSVTAYRECRIEYQADEGKTRKAVLDVGESRAWSGLRRVRLRVSDAAAVRASGPDGPIVLPASGGPADVVVTLAGVEMADAPEASGAEAVDGGPAPAGERAAPAGSGTGGRAAASGTVSAPGGMAEGTDPLKAGTRAYREGRYGDAIPLLERAAASNPAEPRALELLGASHYGLGEIDAAIAAYERYVRLEPADVRAREFLEELKRRKVE